MSLRFIVGRSGKGKTQYCLDEIAGKINADPLGDQIIYLVPDQMTFLSESKLVTDFNFRAMMRAQVYSFSRLAWRVLQETGGANRFHLNKIGLNMLVRKIIEDKKAEFQAFQLVAGKPGFVNEIAKTIEELRRYCVTAEDMFLILNKPEKMDKDLQNKLWDLHLIYSAFEEAFHGKFIDTEDYLSLLAEKLSSWDELKSTDLYIDGFYDFSPQEYEVIYEMLQHCRSVTITITSDDGKKFAADDLSLFRKNNETAASLIEMARSLNREILDPIILEESFRWENKSLEHLEKNFERRPALPYEEESSLTICEADNRWAEINNIAREILKLVREGKYSFKDIAILQRDNESYNDLIKTIFSKYKIPVHLNSQDTMLNHPLVELIRSSLEVVASNWSYDPVFRAFKTELLYPKNAKDQDVREDIDLLENYVLAYGLRGKAWHQEENWKYRKIRGLEFLSAVQTDEEKEIEEQINETRRTLSAPIRNLAHNLKTCTTGRQYCEVLFTYLVDVDIKGKLQVWQDRAEEAGNLLKSDEHRQVWEKIINLLDQFAEALGDEELSLKQFRDVLESGFEQLTFNNIPPSLDQVVLADFENSRLADVKVAFVIGVNEGVLPARLSEDGLIADNEREFLTAEGLELAPTSKTRLLDEQFIAYRVFTLASHKLYVSYPISSEDGKGLMPSFYIKRLKQIIPRAKKVYFRSDPRDLSHEEQLQFIATKETAIAYLVGEIEGYQDNYQIANLWWELYNYLITSSKKHLSNQVIKSLFYSNRTEGITETTAESLYGKDILASVSRIELYNRCPFSHYAQYGLGLREREEFSLEPPQIGELFHASLKEIGLLMLKNKINWGQLSEAECKKLARLAVAEVAPKLHNQILLSSPRLKYTRIKLERIVKRVTLILNEQAKSSKFDPVGYEVNFGRKGDLPALSLPLEENREMHLRGQIDRIDRGFLDGHNYLRVVDYKSSEQGFNYTNLYNGIALQILTYLDIVTTYAEQLIDQEALPAGALYFHIHNKLTNVDKQVDEVAIELEKFKQFKMRGFLVDNPELAQLMDTSLESGFSTIAPFRITKNKTLVKDNALVTKDEVAEMIKFVRSTYIKSGREIIAGNVDISPFKNKKQTPCTYCAYKAVCQFDDAMLENNYRHLQTIQKDEFFDLIVKEEIN